MIMLNILATVFGGSSDRETSAYDGRVLSDTGLYVALPARFKSPRPQVRVTNPKNGVSCVASIEDVGPWNTHDAYWDNNRRPQAESGRDLNGIRTNKAGIDLSPTLAKFLGINGMGLVNWEFEEPDVGEA